MTLILFATGSRICHKNRRGSRHSRHLCESTFSLSSEYLQDMVASSEPRISHGRGSEGKSSEEVEWEIWGQGSRQRTNNIKRKAERQVVLTGKDLNTCERISVFGHLLGMGFLILIQFHHRNVAVTFEWPTARRPLDYRPSKHGSAAIRPTIYGQVASLLFSLGILGTGLLALQVIAGFLAPTRSGKKWDGRSVSRAHLQAKGFYAVLDPRHFVGYC